MDIGMNKPLSAARPLTTASCKEADVYKRQTIKFITFGGKEKTYHAWDGISKEQLENDRTYNPNGVILDDNKGKGNPIGFYDDQTDNYRQTHYQLLFNHIFSPAWNLNIAFHYTNGFGYYQEYKNGRKMCIRDRSYTLIPKPGIMKRWVNGFTGGLRKTDIS